MMRISMPRGDIKWIRFRITTPDKEKAQIDFTNIYFTVKKTTKDSQFLFQKSYKRGEIFKLGPGDYQLKIEAADTQALDVGAYKFDFQISFKNLLKETFVGDFVLNPEVTYYTNEDEEEDDQNFSLPTQPDKPVIILTIPNYFVLELKVPDPVVIDDYNSLINLPTIDGVPIQGDLSIDDLVSAGFTPLSQEDLDNILT